MIEAIAIVTQPLTEEWVVMVLTQNEEQASDKTQK